MHDQIPPGYLPPQGVLGAGLPMPPQLQRTRDYQWQRNYTISELLLETLAIYDTMQFLECPIATYCMGMAASGAAVLLAAGTKGKRFALPHAKVMIHQPWGQIGGQASDVEIQINEILKEKKVLNEILARHSGRTVEEIEAETERDRYFRANEAKEFGLVDEVLEKMMGS